MKKYLLILFTLISLKVVSQTYHPMLDSLTWVTHYYNFTGDWFTWSYSHGDTVIGGNNYQRYTGAYLREDTVTRKVYRWNSTNMADDLLYDFSMSVGDTLPTTRGPAVVLSIDSLLTNLGYRTRWHLVWSDGNGNYPLVIVEGLGCMSDPIDFFMLPNFDPQWYVTCWYNHGVKTYGNFCPNYLANFQFMVNPSTCGLCNGSVMVFATFIPDTLWWTPVYSWTPHGPTVIGGLCPLSTGTVIVTQTSTNFQYLDTYMIQDNPAPVIQNTNTTPVSCSNCCDGSITEIVSSGMPPYTFSWSPNVSTTNTATGLCQGTYIITVSDSLGCTNQDTVTISFTTGINQTVNPQSISIPSLLRDDEVLIIRGLEPISKLEIFDMAGMRIFVSENYQNEFGGYNLAAGMYAVRLTTPNGSVVKQKLCIVK